MVFASHLRQIADHFRSEYLNSNDEADRTLMPNPIESQGNGSAWMRDSWPLAPALGGPFLAVHWRCGDFVNTSPGRWNYTPSPVLAAKQIIEAAQDQKLDIVYLATDASESGTLLGTDRLKCVIDNLVFRSVTSCITQPGLTTS